MKITPADKYFSYCVRERAEWRCERCGTYHQPPTRALHCSHFEGRGNWAVRFEPDNGIALCMGCHLLVGARPGLHSGLHAEIFGKYAADIVKEKSQDLMLAKEIRRTKGKGEIAKHFKTEYERMMDLRAQGVGGRIEFIGY